MMEMLLEMLISDLDLDASVLYSDIGKEFYGRMGWKCDTAGLQTVTLSTSSDLAQKWSTEVPTSTTEPISSADIDDILRSDANLLETELSRYSSKPATSAFLVCPTEAAMSWHHRNSDFYVERLRSHPPPSIRGAKIPSSSSSTPDSLAFTIWNHDWRSNSLIILRFRASNSEHAKLLLAAAVNEARSYNFQQVVLWDPSSAVLRALQDVDGHSDGVLVEERSDSLSSIAFWGFGPTVGEGNLKWICNEKYAWV
ncbi:hypothetical protein HDV00_012063 [Rhizophlyctis rosea]|nr:hypothetical protein HDV00_012063 [Rhizophlyctis rosea]